ncbi:phosphotriesterase-related protein-like [Anneissia japonica]|uniref:phosphotriesterase-related protein-like n=1 Tax=Anneissia japonica TaxID=1529436 RepID=UPI00142591AA|nr:phosphotriesterase-related protein-like [Anneissia japonica]
MTTDFKDSIQTVLGSISPSEIGRTLTHEHLHVTFVAYWRKPNDEYRGIIDTPITMKNLKFLKHFPYSVKANLDMRDEADAVIEELEIFKQNGGTCIVDVTPVDIGRDIQILADYSKKTGVHIVGGTGYYLCTSMPTKLNTMTEEEIVTEMKSDLTEGADGTNIKCGVIGEVGCSWPVHPNEQKVLCASGIAQSELGCPVIIHPGISIIDPLMAPIDHLRVFQEAGGVARHTVMSHVDRCCPTVETALEFAKHGCYLEYDFFGLENSYYEIKPGMMEYISDAQRINIIKGLVDEGYADQVLISHDVHAKHQLLKYGGHGYSHILENVVPKMLLKGISQDNIDRILIDNPRSWLTYY